MLKIKYGPLLVILSLLVMGICIPVKGEEKEKEVNGRVVDASTGKTIEGITVSVKDFSSAITKADGSFILRIPNGSAVLRVSGLNYQPTELPVRDVAEVVIHMHGAGYRNFYEEAETAWGKIKPAYSTQSLSSLNVIETGWKMPAISPEKAFEGRIAGMNVIPRSGNPGIGSNLFIRGFTSMYATNQPLIIVDGMIYDNESYGSGDISGFRTNPLADMAIYDIESISVLKDAASVYGAKAANGVIFIRTTHAYNYATKIELTSYGGVNLVPDEIPLLNAGEYRPYLNELLLTKGLTSDSAGRLPYMIDDVKYPDYYRYHNDENWQKKIFNESFNQNYNLKITGGDDIALYALSVGYMNHRGIVTNTDFSRFNMRFNSDVNITRQLKMNANISVTNAQRNLMPEGSDLKTNPYLISLRKAPFLYEKVRNSQGIISPNMEDADIFGVSNPVALISQLTAINRNYRIFGSFNVGYNFKNAFTISNLIGVNYGKYRDNLFVPHLGVADEILDLGTSFNEMGHRVERIFGVNNDFNIRFNKTYAHKQGVSAIAGIRSGAYKTQEDQGAGYNSPNDEMRSVGTGNILLRKIGGYIGNWNWLTLYASAQYDYLMKYFVSVSTSLDGSSRFGDEAEGVRLFGNSFGFFPSVSVGWLLSSEKFMIPIRSVNLLKIRVSYGKTGNDDIGNYTAQRYYRPQSFLGAQGLIAGNIGNPRLKWEDNTKFTAGLDLAAFRERVQASFDLYSNVTSDMINYVPLSPASGFSYFIENNGTFRSNGFDLSVNGRLINTNVKWDIGVTFSHYRTEVTHLAENQVINTIGKAGILTRVGQPLGMFYGYRTKGIYPTAQAAAGEGLSALIDNTVLIPYAAGDVWFDDTDGNKIIDDNDRQIIGNPNPDFTGMITTNVAWKGITLAAGMSFTYGNEVYNQTLNLLESMENYDNQLRSVLNRWRTEGQVTTMPGASWGDPVGNARFSDRWIEDGSFMRLKYLTLSYQIPVSDKIMNKAEIFVTGQNLLTFTRYKGPDPEFSLSDLSLAQGIDIGLTPQPRAVFIGFRLGL